jgi:hypothetical protein
MRETSGVAVGSPTVSISAASTAAKVFVRRFDNDFVGHGTISTQPRQALESAVRNINVSVLDEKRLAAAVIRRVLARMVRDHRRRQHGNPRAANHSGAAPMPVY